MAFYRTRIFPLLSGLLWAGFLFLDLTRLGDSTGVKFAGICLCAITALLGAKTLDGKLVAAALGFTVGADWFLLVLDDHYLVGIGLFLIVQLLYALRLSLLQEKGSFSWWRWVRVDIALLLLLGEGFLFYWVRGYSLFLFLPLLYFSNLCINTFEAFALKKLIFAVGLLLFICCDLCVGGWNLGILPALTRVGMWFFYLPSQVLIVLSQEERESHHEKGL